MYLVDTNVISEQRKKMRANPGVQLFFKEAFEKRNQVYISVITLGELRRGVELIRQRGDAEQASLLDSWLQRVLKEFSDKVLDFTTEESQVWGHLRVPHYENAIDKQIAATALTHDLTLVTRNLKDFAGSGVKILNPFSA